MSKPKHTDRFARDLTVREYKGLCDFAYAASCSVSEGDAITKFKRSGDEEAKRKQLAIFEQLGVRSDLARACFQSVAEAFKLFIGIGSESLIDHNEMPSTTSDVATALTNAREWLQNPDNIDRLTPMGATQQNIDAAFNLFEGHINGKILAPAIRTV